MKIAFLSSMNALYDRLVKHEEIKEVVRIDSIDEVQVKEQFDALIVDELEVGISDLIEIRNQHPLLNICLFANLDSIDTLKTVCAAHDIMALTKEYSTDQMVAQIERNWLSLGEENYQNVISISGTHPQVGVTQTAFAIANAMVSLNYKVGVLGLNYYNPGEIASEVTEYSFDSLYTSLLNKTVNKKQIADVMLEFDGFHYLVGNRNPKVINHYQIDAIKFLIDQLKEEFDMLLLDLGSIYNTSASLAGLYFSQKHLLIATQQEQSIRSFKRWQDHVFHEIGMQSKDFLLMVNKYSPTNVLTPKQISDELETTLLSQIPFVLGAEDTEHEHGSLANKASSKPYMKAFVGVSKALVSEFENEEKPRRKLLGVI